MLRSVLESENMAYKQEDFRSVIQRYHLNIDRIQAYGYAAPHPLPCSFDQSFILPEEAAFMTVCTEL